MTRIQRPRGIAMEPQEFQQRRLRLGLLVKDLARLLDIKEQSLRNFESMGASRRRPNRQLVRLLQVAEEPEGLALLERIAARSGRRAPTQAAPTAPPEDTQVRLLAEAIVGDILAVIQQAYPSAWQDIAANLRGIVTKQMLWIVCKVLSGEDGQEVMARRAVINARRTAGKNGKSAKKGLQSPET